MAPVRLDEAGRSRQRPTHHVPPTPSLRAIALIGTPSARRVCRVGLYRRFSAASAAAGILRTVRRIAVTFLSVDLASRLAVALREGYARWIGSCRFCGT